MREDVARMVYPVLLMGLSFRERLRQGRPLSLDAVQAELKSRLNFSAGQRGALAGDGDDRYLGFRYPLVCWLDELFIIDSPWQREWSPKALEPALYETRDRAHVFWHQASLASARSDTDALEVFYLCMLLGFRGDLRGNAIGLTDWRNQFETQIGLKRGSSWPEMPPELPLPQTDVAALRAKDRLRWLLLALGAVVGCAIVITALLMVYQVGG